MKRYLAMLGFVLVSSAAFGNTGIFEGSGHTIRLIHSEEIQMRSETVKIIPGRGRFCFDGANSDRVEYQCKFVLQNRSSKPVTIQAGFPLNSQFLRNADDVKAEDVTALVIKYGFIVRDQDCTYHVRFAPRDEEKTVGAIFLWDMTFQANEVRELNVAYQIPMAMGLGDTAREWDVQYAKPWYWRVTPCIVEAFEYVTVTGQSWIGPIESAKFDLYIAGFEQYLRDRLVIERPPLTAEQRAEIEKSRKELIAELEAEIKNGASEEIPAELQEVVNDPEEAATAWRIKDRLIYREVLPDGWKEKDGVITWESENYQPGKPITVAYLLTRLPKNPEDVPSFVRLLLGAKPSDEDLSDLREIYLAWYGIPPKSDSVRQFVANQRWYSVREGLTVDALTAEQKAVISAIEQCSTTVPDNAGTAPKAK